MTPPIASVPYRADAPSSSTSTRSSAAAGMLFKSTPASSPGDAKLAMRRPFNSTSVDDVPMPRRLALLKPRWSPPTLMLTPSVKPFTLAEMRPTISAAVVTPALSISARVIVCTGNVVAACTRRIAEPVISTFGRAARATSWAGAAGASWTSCAATGAHATAIHVPATSAARTARTPVLSVTFMYILLFRALLTILICQTSNRREQARSARVLL
jgi:hypothetical protein